MYTLYVDVDVSTVSPARCARRVECVSRSPAHRSRGDVLFPAGTKLRSEPQPRFPAYTSTLGIQLAKVKLSGPFSSDNEHIHHADVMEALLLT
jgi:hypothetical protein